MVFLTADVRKKAESLGIDNPEALYSVVEKMNRFFRTEARIEKKAAKEAEQNERQSELEEYAENERD